MSNYENDSSLTQLIYLLTKSEKRYFKLYSNRNRSNESDFQFVKLFDIIDKNKGLNTKAINKAFPQISSKQLSDLKRHLYNQILECLRVYNSKNEVFSLTAKIETARILYSKGLFLDSLNILKKAKQVAYEYQRHTLVYEIIVFEKDIESRHVTRTHSTRVQELEAETDYIRKIIRSEADWSEFALKLYAKFLQVGHVKNQRELEEVSDYFNYQKPYARNASDFLFFESLNQKQAYGWYNYIIQNFVEGYKYSMQWIALFDKFPNFKKTHPHLLIKGFHNCLSVLFYCTDTERHEYYLEELKNFVSLNQSSFDQNTKLITFIYLNNARINSIILTGEFSQSKAYLKEFENELMQLDVKIDDHRLMVFWYRMASIYFTMGDYGNCIRLLNKVINPNQLKLREDLQCFARLLNLIAHFEVENDELLTYLIKSTYRFLLKMNDVTQLHEILINFLKISLFKERKDLKEAFIQLKEELDQLNTHQFEKRAFLYLDIISWLESKIEHQSVEAIIFNKRKQLSNKKPKYS